MDRVQVQPSRQMLLAWRRELLAEMRSQGRRVRRVIAQETPRRTGNARRRLTVRAGWDSGGPWARITTTALRRTTSKRTGRTTRFRYGLALQYQTDYLGRGLQKVPRR